jgi:hypothetical protein
VPWLESRGIELIRGHGRLAGERRVRVGDEVYLARDAVVIAVGSAAAVPPIPGLGEAAPLTNRIVRGGRSGRQPPCDAIARLRAFARGELGLGEASRRLAAHAAARAVSAPAAVAAARAAGQAASIRHMGAHALGAAVYAAKAT